MNFLSNLLTIYIPIVVIVWFLARKNKLGWNLLLISVISAGISVILKELFRSGVNEMQQGFQLSKYNFPSLSVQLAISFWLYLAMQYRKTLLYFIAGLITIFVAYQKLTANQHNILDVLAGFVFGLLTVVAFIKLKPAKAKLHAKI